MHCCFGAIGNICQKFTVAETKGAGICQNITNQMIFPGHGRRSPETFALTLSSLTRPEKALNPFKADRTNAFVN